MGLFGVERVGVEWSGDEKRVSSCALRLNNSSLAWRLSKRQSKALKNWPNSSQRGEESEREGPTSDTHSSQ